MRKRTSEDPSSSAEGKDSAKPRKCQTAKYRRCVSGKMATWRIDAPVTACGIHTERPSLHERRACRDRRAVMRGERERDRDMSAGRAPLYTID